MRLNPAAQMFQGDLAILGVKEYSDILGQQLPIANHVLATGSSNSHSHRLASPDGATAYEVTAEEKRRLGIAVFFLEKPNQMIAETHDPIPMEPGAYLIRRQREINADLEVTVQD